MSNVSIAITADVADITGKLALVQSKIREFSTDTRQAADAMREAGAAATNQMRAGLETSATSLAKAKAEATALTNELKALNAAPVGLLGGMKNELEGLGASITSVTGLFGKLSEIFLAGFAIERIASAIEAMGKLGESLELASQKTGIAASKLADLKYAAEQNNVEFDTLQQALRGMGRTVESAIEKPTGKAGLAYKQLGLDTDYLRENQNNLLAILLKVADAYQTGGTYAQQDANSQAIFLRSAKDLLPFLQEGSGKLLELMQRHQAFWPITDKTVAKLAEEERATKDLSSAWEAFRARMVGAVAPDITVSLLSIAGEKTRAEIKSYENELNQVVALLQETRARRPSDGWLGGLFDDAMIANYERKIDQLKAKIAGLGGAVPKIGGPEETKPGGTGAAGEGAARKPWAPIPDNSTAPTELAKFRTTLAEMEAGWDGTHEKMLAEAVKMWETELNSGKLNAKELIEARKGLADAQRQLSQDTARTNQTIARQDADTTVQLGKIKLETAKQELDAEVAAHQITAERKIEILRGLVQQEHELDIQRLNEELDIVGQERAARDRVNNQILVDRAKLNQQMAALDREAADAAKKDAEEQARAWKGAIGEVTSAERTFLTDYLTGRKTAKQSVAALVDELLLKEITSDAAAFTSKTIYSALGLQLDAKEAQGGILWELIAQQRKNAATAGGVATRNTINAGEGTGLFTLIPQMIGRWIGMETAKSTATETGALTRKGVEVASTISGLGMQVAAGFAEIEVDASVAAAGAFAATAQIPYVGPELAPAAATAAYEAVMGWAAGMGGGVALATGAWNIPTTMGATLHQGEIVMPKPFADEYRANAARGKTGDNSFSMGDVHVHVATEASPAMIAAAVAEQVRAFNPSLMNIG